MFLMVVMSTLLLAACGGNENNSAANDSQNDEQPNVQVEEVDPEKVVAKVNGEEIKGQEYNEMMQQMMMMQFGMAADPDTMKEQTLNTLIDQELLSQEVASKGYKASDEEINDTIEEIKASYESEAEFEEALKNIPLTVDTLKDQIAEDLAFREYLDKELTKAEITDEQVKEYYNEAKEAREAQEEQADAQPFPELADVQDQIKGELEKQETQKQLQAIVEELKANSDIEKLI